GPGGWRPAGAGLPASFPPISVCAGGPASAPAASSIGPSPRPHDPKVLAPVTNDDGLHHPPPGAQPSSRAGRVGPIDPAPCTPGGRSPDGAGSTGPTPGRGVTLATAAAVLREHWEPEMRAHLLAVIRNLLELGGWDSR